MITYCLKNSSFYKKYLSDAKNFRGLNNFAKVKQYLVSRAKKLSCQLNRSRKKKWLLLFDWHPFINKHLESAQFQNQNEPLLLYPHMNYLHKKICIQ